MSVPIRPQKQNILTAWYLAFFAIRGLDRPTGKHLFAYRASEEEFLELERVLKVQITGGLKHLPFDFLAEHTINFAALFVFYAAEWWKRRYDGSRWSWDPIVEGIGADPHAWPQQQRTTCIVKGLREWGLRPQEGLGFRYLGSIATNGGLPLKLIAEAKGNVGRLLRKVLGLASSGRSSPVELYGWIESLSTLLPRSYRQADIYNLLATIITAALKLREDLQLKTHDGLLELLDSKEPTWRDRFPLALEDQHARGLIEQLIQDAVAAPATVRTPQAHVWRGIELDLGGRPTLRSEVVLPERIESAALASLFGSDASSLPRLATLRWTSGSKTRDLMVRKLSGHERYRLDLSPLECRGLDAICEQRLELSGASGIIGRIAVPRGSSLSDDLPWVFGKTESNADSWSFLRQGPGAVVPSDICIAVPPDWSIEPQGTSAVTFLGELLECNRNVFAARGNVNIVDEQGEHHPIRTQQADASHDVFEWSGVRVWDLFNTPTFRSRPQVFSRTPDGLRANTAEKVLWCVPGAISSRDPGVGPFEARWPRDGRTRWKSRVIVLTSSAGIQFIPGEAPNEGAVRLCGWGVSSVACLNGGVECRSHHEGEAVVLQLRIAAGAAIPKSLDFEARWAHTTTTAPFSVPFPSWGVASRDAAGAELRDYSSINVSAIHGVRLAVMFGNDRKATLSLTLNDSRPKKLMVSSVLHPADFGQRVEIRPLDYRAAIDELLSSTAELDSNVDLTISIGMRRAFTLHIKRFDAELRRNEHEGHVFVEHTKGFELERIESTNVSALLLSDLETVPAHLPALVSQDVSIGAWRFDPPGRSPGPWLIYPDAESSIRFRPQLWPVSNGLSRQARGGLAGALEISRSDERYAALTEAITALTDDFSAPDWALVERLATQLGHLPLATLDLWRVFAQSGLAMASLACRMSVPITRLVNRFTVELPFLWELVSFSDWCRSMSKAFAQAEQWLGPAHRPIALNHLKQRCESVGEQAPALHALLGAAYACATGEQPQDIQFARKPSVDEIFRAQLYEADDCHLQRLMRDKADDEWPTMSLANVRCLQEPQLRSLLHRRLPGDYRDAAIIVPVELAVQAALSHSGQWLSNPEHFYKLKSFRAFDSDWFSEAFHLTVVRCLSQKIIQW
ncbi:STY4851/ECs_5259 family protein [Nevskia sp.]|uniref:STY4851/ECs_5259 family protein n=1 Tax=Nevskia sp. TaxID=1929292 RepID=UPI003F71BB67